MCYQKHFRGLLADVSPRLPLEMWDRIIDHLWNDRASLEACSLACSDLLISTRVHIFRNVQAHLHCEQDCDALADLEAPYTAQPLRYIGILNLGRSAFFHAEPDAAAQAQWLNDKLPPLVSELIGVDTLHLLNVIWAKAIPRALEECPWSTWLRIYIALTPMARTSIKTLSPQIRTLQLRTVWFEGHRTLQDFLTSFSGLVELDLQDIVIGGPLKPGQRITSILDLSSLKRLSVVQLRVASILRKDGALEVLASKFSPEFRELRIMFSDLAPGSRGQDLACVKEQWQRWDEAIAIMHRLSPHVLVRLLLECIDFGNMFDSGANLATSVSNYDAYIERLAKELWAFLRISIDAGTHIIMSCTPPKEMPFKAFQLTVGGPEPCQANPVPELLQGYV
ncbi:hypothetical protein DAEQUDRAFT_89329 [Daedalea quercina L-15889]|uniref:Uncharacterized protein n=1 Tax=Daedalea quercina L-15889 TaxID=1314783 RepID=A0A165KXU5_9APHY|nr:hypothetical protein DAEQUDRAFT_89329 [Daedalea quercina L-15889]